MKASRAFLLALSVLPVVLATPALGAEEPPAWAYPVNPPNIKLAPDDGVPRRVPNSTATYSLTQIRDRFISPVWHPGDHPLLPEVVAQGRKPDVFACGFCHRAGGTGGPENANLTGFPASYIVQQMADYKSGARKTAVAKRNIELMISLSKAATDEEIRIAAEYFSALKPVSNVKVVESDIAPKTFTVSWHLAAEKSGEKEGLGQRIIEVPDVLEQFANRDSRAPFTAYVPVGSLEKGRALATTGGGKTLQCATCHGAELKGLGPIPRIAGLSPSYIVRQLYDFKHGARAGPSSALMKASVDKLTVDDMAALAAYVASLAP
jgi:cytochrome c553